MKKTDNGYDCVVGGIHKFSLPTDSKILEQAVEICIAYDSEDTEAVRILKSADIHLEVVDDNDSAEKLIGVVLSIDESDAEKLRDDHETYNDIMSALGESCSSIESDRVAVRP